MEMKPVLSLSSSMLEVHEGNKTDVVLVELRLTQKVELCDRDKAGVVQCIELRRWSYMMETKPVLSLSSASNSEGRAT